MRRTESIKFGEFMNGNYKIREKQKKARIGAVAKRVAVSSMIVTASKVAVPAAVVSIPVLMLAGHAVKAATTTAPIVIDAEAVEVMGTISDAAKAKIIHAFDPLVDLMVALSLPIAGVMVTGGCLMVLIGMKEKGYGLITNSALGYVLVQMSPLLIDMLAGVGKAL